MRYLTDEELQKVKGISLEMLIYFDDFCKKNNLQYMISCGTALGAVRHKGFIPWDDDVDVSMPIDDYAKLYKIWIKNGDKDKYFLQTKKTDENLGYPFYRLRLNNTTWSDIDCKNIPLHWGIPIDIFPVYNLAKSSFMQKIQSLSFGYGNYFSIYAYQNPNASKIKKRFFRLLTEFLFCVIYMISCFNTKSKTEYSPNDSSAISKNNSLEKGIRFPSKSIVFENNTLQGPAEPDKYLCWKYGDYMKIPSENQRQRHSVEVFDLENDSSKYTGVKRRNK